MLLSIDQVAERVGVHPSTLRRWLKSGLENAEKLPKPLPVKALGGGRLWRESEIERWRSANLKGLPKQAPQESTEVPRKLALVR
ncbi:MAG: helix-turn-helix transcriptional regulator [Actinomycetota bacterium]